MALLVKSNRRNEAVIAYGLVRHLTSDMLLLADREFYSYSLWKTCLTQGCPLLWRIRSNIVLTPIEVLDDGSFLAKISANPKDREADRHGVVVRVIRYTLDDPTHEDSGQPHVLITTLRDIDAFPAVELILGYHQRWEQELMYDEQKTHQDPVRAGKAAHVRSETPEAWCKKCTHYHWDIMSRRRSAWPPLGTRESIRIGFRSRGRCGCCGADCRSANRVRG